MTKAIKPDHISISTTGPIQPARSFLHPILRKLDGGDRRSVGRVGEVVSEVLHDPTLLSVLFDGMLSSSPVIRMRCADAVEKVTAQHPEYLQPYKELLLTKLAGDKQKEVRWHVAPMLARLILNAEEQEKVLKVLLSYLSDQSSIVKTFAMQALADFAMRSNELQPMVLARLKEFVITGTPAMKARGKKLLARLEAV